MVQSAHPVIAPYRIIDEALARVVYSAGEPMTDADAKKYLGIDRSKAEPEPEVEPDAMTARARKASADRAKRLAADRAKRPAKDR